MTGVKRVQDIERAVQDLPDSELREFREWLPSSTHGCALGNEADYAVLPERTHMSAIRKLSERGDPVFAVVLDFVRKFGGTDRN
jgi:hypothetical protein